MENELTTSEGINETELTRKQFFYSVKKLHLKHTRKIGNMKLWSKESIEKIIYNRNREHVE